MLTQITQMQVTHTAETIIADRIGFRYDTDTGVWYNANGLPSTEENAGYVAYYHGFDYNDMTTPGLRLGWMEARGYDAYASEMANYLKFGDMEYAELPF